MILVINNSENIHGTHAQRRTIIPSSPQLFDVTNVVRTIGTTSFTSRANELREAFQRFLLLEHEQHDL
jgi:hypothetical protein